MQIYTSIDDNIKLMKRLLPLEKSFDVVGRELLIGDTRGYLVFVDGFAKDDALIHIFKELQGAPVESADSVKLVLEKEIPYIEIGESSDADALVTAVLSGPQVLFVDGLSTAITIDARQYPARNPEESQVEKVTRGPRDGMVETIVFNTALIRRRVRDPGLTFEMTTVGRRSKTDVAIGYIGDLADEELLVSIRKKLDAIDAEALPMGEKSLEELLIKKKWYNPFPIFRYSERPDTLAAHLLEGHVILMVDTSPSAIIIPTSFFYFTQYIEDYYQTPMGGNLTRFLRFMAFPGSILFIPLWLLCIAHMNIMPEWLHFLAPKETAAIPLFVQFLLLEVGLKFLQLSSLHTPQNLESAFSIIGGLILGEFAVQVGLFVPNTIFFSVASAIAGHCIPNSEMGSAVRICRLFLITLTGLFDIWGLGIGIAAILLIIFTTQSFDRRHSYTWPLIPFNKEALCHLLFRYPAGRVNKRNR